jgi:hypothetical protein
LLFPPFVPLLCFLVHIFIGFGACVFLASNAVHRPAPSIDPMTFSHLQDAISSYLMSLDLRFSRLSATNQSDRDRPKAPEIERRCRTAAHGAISLLRQVIRNHLKHFRFISFHFIVTISGKGGRRFFNHFSKEKKG